jgi:hypothetical protein
MSGNVRKQISLALLRAEHAKLKAQRDARRAADKAEREARFAAQATSYLAQSLYVGALFSFSIINEMDTPTHRAYSPRPLSSNWMQKGRA